MTYAEYQRQCASFGFIETPLTWKEFCWLCDNGFEPDSIYRIGCDVAAGFDLVESIQSEQES